MKFRLVCRTLHTDVDELPFFGTSRFSETAKLVHCLLVLGYVLFAFRGISELGSRHHTHRHTDSCVLDGRYLGGWNCPRSRLTSCIVSRRTPATHPTRDTASDTLRVPKVSNAEPGRLHHLQSTQLSLLFASSIHRSLAPHRHILCRPLAPNRSPLPLLIPHPQQV